MNEPIQPDAIGSPLIAEVERIRREGKRLAVAIACAALIALDLMIVMKAESGSRHRTALKVATAPFAGGHPHARLIDVFIYETPTGLRLVSREGNDMERAAAEIAGVDPDAWDKVQASVAVFPPAEWKPVAYAGILNSLLESEGWGILTPSFRRQTYQCFVQSSTMQPLTDEQTARYREMYCDWLAAESDWASPETARYASELKKGDKKMSWIGWPSLIHDIVVLAAFSWSGWTILRTPIPTFARFRRIRCGHCPRCDYDLVNDFEKGCPECGWGKQT